jgi:hypothetical protein
MQEHRRLFVARFIVGIPKLIAALTFFAMGLYVAAWTMAGS